MSTLHLTLKKKWFDMTASGEKKEEYREIKPYWINRLTWHEWHKKAIDLETLEYCLAVDATARIKTGVFTTIYDSVTLKNGYAKDSPLFRMELESITIGEGNPEWGAEKGRKYFIIKYGNRL